ncbi:MAG TPA: diaminopimelate epimerase, partial [Minicystis sp.]|nr:diaminopimelate epimerase [Minicystis sp.]
MTIRFEKWEGLGNDFLLIEAAPFAAEVVKRLCDRRRGVGGDGVLFVEGAPAEGAARMTVLNADGSRPEMCGNGVRCVAGLVVARRGLAEATIEILTDAGPRACRVRAAARGVYEVSVDMGAVTLGAELVIDDAGRAHRFTTADVGNPHAVTFAPFDDAAIDRVGARVAAAPPAGFNAEFCRASAGGVDVVV